MKKEKPFLNSLKELTLKRPTLYSRTFIWLQRSLNNRKSLNTNRLRMLPIERFLTNVSRSSLSWVWKESPMEKVRICHISASVCIMSGGQGTRLGFDHPKGMFDIGLDSHFTLFEFFARRLLGLMSIAKKQFPDSKFT